MLQKRYVLKLDSTSNEYIIHLTFSQKVRFIFTNCVRSTREGYVLTCVCSSICLSTPRGGRYPSQVQPREGTPSRGVPYLRSPPPRWTWPGGYPCWGEGVPNFGKQMVYLIRRGRYASCIHAGGLSCFKCRDSERVIRRSQILTEVFKCFYIFSIFEIFFQFFQDRNV